MSDQRSVTLTTAQCDEIIDVGRNELRQAERSVRELLYGVNEQDLDQDEGEELADARERVELWTGILKEVED